MLLVCIASVFVVGESQAQSVPEPTLRNINPANGAAIEGNQVAGTFLHQIIFMPVGNYFSDADLTASGNTIVFAGRNLVVVTGGTVRDVAVRAGTNHVIQTRIDVTDGAQTVRVQVPPNVLTNGNQSGEITYTVVPPITVDFSTNAVEPVQSNFNVNLEFSHDVTMVEGAEQADYRFDAADDLDASGGAFGGFTRTPPRKVRVQARPNTSTPRYFTLRLKERSVATGPNTEIWNVEQTFRIRVGPYRVQFEEASYVGGEGAGALEIPVLLEPPAKDRLEIGLKKTLVGGASNDDFSGVPGSVTFAPGESEKIIRLSVTADSEVEDETEGVVLGFEGLADLTAPRRTVAEGNTETQITFVSKPVVAFGSPSYRAFEGGQGATVAVEIQPAADIQVVIGLDSTHRNGASAGDWSGLPSSLTFNAGQTSKTFTITAIDDTAEDPGEGVELGITSVTGDIIVGSRSTTLVRLEDDDTTYAEGDLRLVEGTSNEGLLEVFHNRQWGTVCDDRVDNPGNIAPEFACQLMGFATGTHAGNRGIDSPGLGSQPIWLDDLRCLDGSTHWTGSTPTQLSHCFHAGWGLNNCGRAEDVAIRCSGTPDVMGQGQSEPLTAEFAGAPESHDGSSAFTFRIDFSDDVDIEPAEMKDHALTVSDGTVTNAARVDGRDDLWAFTIEPTSTNSITILVQQGRACTEQGALCTADGRTLHLGLAKSIPYA